MKPYVMMLYMQNIAEQRSNLLHQLSSYALTEAVEAKEARQLQSRRLVGYEQVAADEKGNAEL